MLVCMGVGGGGGGSRGSGSPLFEKIFFFLANTN